jgi:hypothetical protein
VLLNRLAGTEADETGNEVVKLRAITKKGIEMYHRAEGECADQRREHNANRLAEQRWITNRQQFTYWPFSEPCTG